MNNTQTIVTETVSTSRSKREDRIVISVILSILAFAALSLHLLYGNKDNDVTVVPKGLQHHLTSLSVATEEISMLFEGLEVDLDQLYALDIAPFSQPILRSIPTLIWQQHQHCFIGLTQIDGHDYQLRFLYLPPNNSSIEWRIFQSSTLEAACAEIKESRWQPANRLDSNAHHH
jgi:hypothetical protein